MYICSQSGELVHPIHLKHLVDEEEDGGGEYGPDDDTIAHNADAISPSPMEHGAPIGGDAPEEKSGGLERGAPVHCG